MEDLYIEDWWIKALAERDEWHGIWHRNFFTVSPFWYRFAFCNHTREFIHVTKRPKDRL